MSSSLSCRRCVLIMSSQCPSAAIALRIPRQRLAVRPGVSLSCGSQVRGHKDLQGSGKVADVPTLPVSGPFCEMASAAEATADSLTKLNPFEGAVNFRSGTGALLVCILNTGDREQRLVKETAVASGAASQHHPVYELICFCPPCSDAATRPAARSGRSTSPSRKH